MKKIIVSTFIVLSGLTFAVPAFADEATPIACAVDSDGHQHCSTEKPIVVDSTEEPIVVDSTEEPVPIEAPIDAPDCSVDMSACARGGIMYNKQADIPTVSHNDTHKHETWWDIFTDPSHIAAEIGWTIVQDALILGLLYGFVFKKCILPRLTKKIHEDIDKEHGITHE